ncbi:hypothetical protein SBBP2_460009 [Burkholderiales bacterium]|nr:hypothetical protein SBBP2_460009 [Burkholderiales bacterium]
MMKRSYDGDGVRQFERPNLRTWFLVGVLRVWANRRHGSPLLASRYTVLYSCACTHLNATLRRRNHYHVYVIELSKDVLYEGGFRKANPDYIIGKPCVYVGMTGLDPDVRFDKHKAGIQSNRYVQQFGLRLLPHLYEVYNPMPYDGARDMEVELAIGLREEGFGVWQA